MHGVVLTPAGEQILLHAQKILQACDELYAAAREAVTGPGGRRVVHVGIAPGVESPTRNRIVAAVTEADPDAAVALDPDANMHLIRKLIVGELDLAILHQRPISPSVRSFQIGSKRTLVCLARHLPQASVTTLSLNDLNSLPFVTSSALNAGTPVYYAQLRSIFEEAGINRVVDVGAFNLYALQPAHRGRLRVRYHLRQRRRRMGRRRHPYRGRPRTAPRHLGGMGPEGRR